MTIGEQGAAGITSGIAMDKEAISAVASGFRVVERDGSLEGTTHSIFTLDVDGETVFTVMPSPDGSVVHAVLTRSTRVRGPLDEIVRRFRFEDANAEDIAFCLSEHAAETPSFACAASPNASFWRVFALPEAYRGPGAPFEALDQAAKRRATLIEMRWFAPAGLFATEPDNNGAPLLMERPQPHP